MKKIEAIIKPEKLMGAKSALEHAGVSGITITEVMGRGTQKGITLQWRAGDYRVEFLEKIKLEVVVDDRDVNDVISAISRVARTGSIGDGKIFITTVDNAVRIRTGEDGVSVI